MTQQRAIDTRADLLAGAATEFARYGYAAASVNNILANTACTKGAMYFHFASKREMAEAILDTATKVYTHIGHHWAAAGDVRPLDALAAMVDAAAEAFVNETALRAEARISLEPEFLERRPWTAWEHSAVELASRAAEFGLFGQGFTPEKFVRVLSASLAGHRLLAHIVPADVSDSIRHGLHRIVSDRCRGRHPSSRTGSDGRGPIVTAGELHETVNRLTARGVALLIDGKVYHTGSHGQDYSSACSACSA